MLWEDGKGGARTALWMIDLVSDRKKLQYELDKKIEKEYY